MAKKKQRARKIATKAKGPRKAKREDSGAQEQETSTAAGGHHADHGFPIVGIGASAGGLAAIRRLLESVPDDPGVAFVIIQHLDPTKKSLAPDLLARWTKMQVAQVEDDPLVKPNRVYLIPPNKYLSISGGELHTSEPEQPRGSRMAIDYFLRSLAKYQPHCAVGVILSGTGTDGTLGAKAIKQAGGLVIAQDPNTADHSGMPRSVIETGVVDHVLPPEAIPEVLIRYAQHPYVRDGAGELPAPRSEDGQQEVEQQPPQGLEGIIGLLRAHGKHDFRNYKDNTVVRRTRRRMSLHHLDDYDQYLEFLRQHPGEIDALIKDLLISVTDFFRDPATWDALAKLVIEPLVEEKDTDDPIRTWVPGCATGEEPYSVAMLLIEALQRREESCPLQVFASDIDTGALQYARAGSYPRSIEADVSPQRLRRFFVRQADDENHYHVSKALREAVVFAKQNLIADPPFSKLDMICCRNLLIYLKAEMQDKVLQLFHFALRPGGYLFLGSSETVGRRGDLFETVSREARIYRCKGPTRHEIVDIPLTLDAQRLEIAPREPIHQPQGARSVHRAEQQLLEMLAPSAVVIDRDREILHIYGDMDRYLRHVPGAPTNDLLEKARHGLRTRLRGAIHNVFAHDEPASVSARVQREGVYHPVRITASRVHDTQRDDDLALVMFEEEKEGEPSPRLGQRKAEGGETQGTMRDGQGPGQRSGEDREFDDSAVIRQLEAELASTKEDLQTTIEQYETSNEEYKAANEEVMSVNEELQSTNEELETSKEELRSVNEELTTVNNQLAEKVAELETKHDDLVNLLRVANVATICLDDELKVRWFSSRATELIRVTSADIGRPITDFAHQFLDSDIDQVASRVLDGLAPEEREVAAKDGRWFLRRTTPYRTEDNRVGGVVITFIDITERKRAEEALRESHDLSEKIIDTVREATLVLDSDFHVVSANESFYRTFEVSHHETEGRLVFELGNHQWDIPALRRLLEKVLPENKVFNNFEVEHEFESIGRRIMLLNGRQIDEIERILLAIEDITELRMAEHRRGFLLELSDVLRSHHDPQAIVTEATSRLCRFLNCGRAVLMRCPGNASSPQEATVLAQHSERLDDLPDRFPLAELGPQALAVLERNEELVVEDVLQDPRFKGTSPNILTEMDIRAMAAAPRMNGGSIHSVLLVARPNRRKWNRQEVALVRDVSERTWSAVDAAHAERALRESEERLTQAAAAAHFGSYLYDFDTDTSHWSRELYAICGRSPGEPIDLDRTERVIHPDDRNRFREFIRDAIESPGQEYQGDFRIVRPGGEVRWTADRGRIIFSGEGENRRPVRAVGMVADITQRKQAEEKLQELNEALETQVSQRTEMLRLLQDITRRANEARTVEEAMLAALERISQYNGWQVGHVWRLDDQDRSAMVSSGVWHATPTAKEAIGQLEKFQEMCRRRRVARGEGIIGTVWETGKPVWVDDIAQYEDWRRGAAANFDLHAMIAFPVLLNDEVVAVLEFFSDHATRREERFMEIMPAVGIQLGQVVERKRLEKEVADATEREQRRLGSDIHDGVGQELTGLRYMTQTHAEALARDESPHADTATRITSGLETVQRQLRAVIRDLIPVELDKQGLLAALRLLAERTAKTHDLSCTLVCDKPIAVEDHLLATHLYRIAQEAVSNALRHAQAEHITITVDEQEQEQAGEKVLLLQVADDGIGFSLQPHQGRGFGLRNMTFRAELVGARLRIEPHPAGGTVVRCTIPRRHIRHSE